MATTTTTEQPQPGQPTPDPPPITSSPWQPRHAPEFGPNSFTIAICGLCGALPGDIHTCVTDAAEVAAALAAPIPYEWTRQVTR